MVKLTSLEIGDKLLLNDVEFGYGETEIILIGYDPYQMQWVAASKEWSEGISHVTDEELENYAKRID